MGQPTRTEINGLITRVRALPELVKFELFTVLRKELAGSLDPEHPEAKLIRERREALEYIGKAIGLLGLGPRQVPTQAQFDQVAKEQEWPWTGARVNRVWERWRNATQAYRGIRKIEAPAARGRRKRERGPKGRAAEKHLQALKTWLASEPELETKTAYDQFAETYNQHLPEGALPLVRASTIYHGLPVSWESAIEVARGRYSLDKAIETELADRLPVLDENTLVGEPLIARVLKTSTQGVLELSTDDPNFPVAVAHLGRHAAWLYEDIKLYRRGLAAPKRKRDERQYATLGVPELAALIDRSEKTVREAIRAQAWDRAPKPEGAIATGVHYWQREKVEAWIEQRAKAEQVKADRKANEQSEKDRARERRQAEREAKEEALARQRSARDQKQRKRAGKQAAGNASGSAAPGSGASKSTRRAASLGSALRKSNVRSKRSRKQAD